ncbi:maleylpyruvate isomerase N-terminal domain-containing protein [[Kitasatospora] papulosa]|uniref:maleylpyruvate isomerase N-terminal domain-containing protein n=1 Tax=[Kitasatospora] papulosa TaxID=1464011 RepID=UPI003828493F
MKTISELLEEATARAVPVVRGIDDAQLAGGTPCSEYDVRALLNHLFSVWHGVLKKHARGHGTALGSRHGRTRTRDAGHRRRPRPVHPRALPPP